MVKVPLDLSNSPIPATIQENMVAYMRLFAGLPGMYIRDDAEAFWFISNRPGPGDQILKARWQEIDVDAQIETIFQQVGNYCKEIGWMVFPGDQPADLNHRLEARGMPGTSGGNWLWADLTQLCATPEMPGKFHIQQVCDDAHMAEWLRVSEVGFGAAGKIDCFYDAYARHGYSSAACSLHYIGYLGDTPVTSATLFDAGGSAAIYDVSTPPELRQQGFGGAITHALMQEIRKRGYASTWIWSSNMARSVYQRLGFVDADFGIREHVWHQE